MFEVAPNSISALAIIAFLILLAASIYMLVDFYVCDNYQCKAFVDADQFAPRGTDQYVILLLNNLYSDGIWSIPYIGAAILTPLLLWFINDQITIRLFAIGFLISFLVIYFLFSFFGHHYIGIISSYAADHIQNNDVPPLELDENIIQENPTAANGDEPL